MSKFIEVSKESEANIFIHPDALADHQRLGWKVVEPVAVEMPEAEEKPEAVRERRPREKAGK